MILGDQSGSVQWIFFILLVHINPPHTNRSFASFLVALWFRNLFVHIHLLEIEAVKEKTVEELGKDVEEHENKLRDIELEIEAEDAVIPRGFAKTKTPTKEENDRHCLTHLPYRSWCPICIQAKKKNIAHKKTKSDRGVPVFSISDMF